MSSFYGNSGGGVSLLSKLKDMAITNPENGDVLFYNNTTAKWQNGKVVTTEDIPNTEDMILVFN